jgi:predicted nucleic acid-binding protein
MVKNVYFDTNIIIDICDEGREKHQESLDIVHKLIVNGAELYINSDTLATLFYILRNRSKMNFNEAMQKIKFINETFELVSIEKKSIDETIDICNNKNFKDYEDALQYICAKKIEADFIVTNDKKFISPDIEVKSSSEYS